jgi:hypothetical protein
MKQPKTKKPLRCAICKKEITNTVCVRITDSGAYIHWECHKVKTGTGVKVSLKAPITRVPRYCNITVDSIRKQFPAGLHF